jgi:hypothetical protein
MSMANPICGIKIKKALALIFFFFPGKFCCFFKHKITKLKKKKEKRKKMLDNVGNNVFKIMLKIMLGNIKGGCSMFVSFFKEIMFWMG